MARTDYSFYNLVNNNLEAPPITKREARNFDQVFREASASLRKSRERRAANLGITYEELIQVELQLAYGEMDKQDPIF